MHATKVLQKLLAPVIARLDARNARNLLFAVQALLASLLVARLHAEGVPVAGVDRLLLSAPLAVQDLLAAARFAIQPLDDLNLACLLVSPLFGWSQDQLYAVAAKRPGALWPAVRDAAAGVWKISTRYPNETGTECGPA